MTRTGYIGLAHGVFGQTLDNRDLPSQRNPLLPVHFQLSYVSVLDTPEQPFYKLSSFRPGFQPVKTECGVKKLEWMIQACGAHNEYVLTRETGECRITSFKLLIKNTTRNNNKKKQTTKNKL